MNARQVFYLGNRVDRIHVPNLPSLRRWPMHGIVESIAWRFDGATLRLVRLRTLERPRRDALA